MRATSSTSTRFTGRERKIAAKVHKNYKQKEDHRGMEQSSVTASKVSQIETSEAVTNTSTSTSQATSLAVQGMSSGS